MNSFLSFSVKNSWKVGFLSIAVVAIMGAVDPTNLIKVTPENDPKCVEYYFYQGATYCSNKPLSTNEPITKKLKNAEKQRIQFDHRPWKLAWGVQSSEGVMLEYVPDDTDINNWHELITSQFFAGLSEKTTPSEFMNVIIQKLQEIGLQPIVTVLKSTPNVVLFEFRIIAPKNQQVDELQKITSEDDGLYILHYAIKKPDMSASERDKWVKLLMDSSIIKSNKIKTK